MILTDSDYKDAMNEFDLLVIKLYAPWCYHCQELAPVFKKLSSYFLNKESPVYFSQIDGEANPKAAEFFNVRFSPYDFLKMKFFPLRFFLIEIR